MSKVALNIAGKTLAGDLKQSHNGTVALIHPGVVSLPVSIEACISQQLLEAKIQRQIGLSDRIK